MTEATDRYERRIAALLLFLLGAIAYANALGGGFHLDDYYRIASNPELDVFWPPWRHFVDPMTMTSRESIAQYRPLLPLSLSVDVAIFGRSVVAFHLQNLLWQIAAAILVWLVVRRLLVWPERPKGSSPAALAVAAVFLVHPVSGIPVNYLCSRDLLIMQVFLLAAFYSWLDMRQKGNAMRGMLRVSIFLLLSLLGKTNAIAFPGLLLLFEWTLGRKRKGPWIPSFLCTVLICAGFFVFTENVLGFSDLQHVSPGKGTLAPWLDAQAYAHAFHYLPNFFYPFPIRFDPAVPDAAKLSSLVLPACGILALLIGLALWLRRRHALLSFSILAYFCLLLPTSSFLPLHAALVDYRPYPSSPFLYLAIALLALRLPARLRSFACILAIVWSLAWALVMNPIYRTDESLWRHSVAQGAGALAHHNLAMAETDLDAREQHLKEALRLQEDYVLARLNLGRTLLWKGKTEEGWKELRAVRKNAPGDAAVQYWYGRSLEESSSSQQDPSRVLREAAECYAQAASLAPHNLDYAYEAARAYLRIPDPIAAAPFLNIVEGRSTEYREYQFLRAYSLQLTKQDAAAIPLYEQFLASHPEHARAWYNLGQALLTMGRPRDAIEALRRCLSEDPDQKLAHQLIATCYEKLGDPRRAALERSKAKSP